MTAPLRVRRHTDGRIAFLDDPDREWTVVVPGFMWSGRRLDWAYDDGVHGEGWRELAVVELPADSDPDAAPPTRSPLADAMRAAAERRTQVALVESDVPDIDSEATLVAELGATLCRSLQHLHGDSIPAGTCDGYHHARALLPIVHGAAGWFSPAPTAPPRVSDCASAARGGTTRERE